MNEVCSICKNPVDAESAAVLSVGGFGTPRYMCAECESDFDEMTRSRDVESINLAIARIGKKLDDSGIDDKVTLRTVEEVMKSSAERKEKIKSGTYDFCEEEELDAESEEDGVPPELRESEEDIENERIKAEKYKKIDNFTNWVLLGVFLGALGFIVYRLLDIWFF